MIRMLDHTADVGFELGAPMLEGLFEEALEPCSRLSARGRRRKGRKGASCG
jgi:hypothetical protein